MAAPSCLDHLSSVGPPGSRNTVVQRNLSGPSGSGRVTTCETPSHHAGWPVVWDARTAPYDRSDRVCYALFRLLRPFTLYCTRKRGVAEGEGA